MRNFIIFGPPGAGKGTQAQKIANEFNLHHLSTGALLREEISRQTEIGQKVQKIMDQGGLVDDSIVNTIVKDKITQNSQGDGFIFDGYPRTMAQAKNLDALLNAKALPLVLNLEVEEKELMERLKLRGQESGRSDDKEETIKNRLRLYSEQTRPLLDFYARQKRLISVNGQGTIEEVFQLLRNQIK